MMESIGWLGGLLLAICALPQTIKVYKEKHANGISYLNLWLWFSGEVCMLLYVLNSNFSWPLFTNYFFNLVFVSIILYFKYFPKTLTINN